MAHPATRPRQSLSDRQFVHLSDTCESLYSRGKSKDELEFALEFELSDSISRAPLQAPTSSSWANTRGTANSLSPASPGRRFAGGGNEIRTAGPLRKKEPLVLCVSRRT